MAETSTIEVTPELAIKHPRDARCLVPGLGAAALRGDSDDDYDSDEECRRPDDTGLRVWQCAGVLIRLMASGVVDVAGKHVVELGSGTGVVGVGAEKCGAAGVVVSDLEDLVPLMESTIQLNDCARTLAKGFRWGEDAIAAFGRTFDVCLLCEVLYWPGLALMEDDTIALLASSVSALLHPEGGAQCVCIFKEREPRRERRFLQLCEANGFAVEDLTVQQMLPRKMQATHERWMREALAEGACALREGEVPVGCVIVHRPQEHEEGAVVGRGSNKTNETRNGTRHAEFVAFDQVAARFGENPPYHEMELYVTCEPCIMCAAAISRLELRKVYFGCHNDRFGGCGSILSLHEGKGLPDSYHRYPIEAGILKEEAVNLFKTFYSQENCRAPEAKRRRKQLHAEGKPSSHDRPSLSAGDGSDDHGDGAAADATRA